MGHSAPSKTLNGPAASHIPISPYEEACVLQIALFQKDLLARPCPKLSPEPTEKTLLICNAIHKQCDPSHRGRP